jgi:hypothetical protein
MTVSGEGGDGPGGRRPFDLAQAERALRHVGCQDVARFESSGRFLGVRGSCDAPGAPSERVSVTLFLLPTCWVEVEREPRGRASGHRVGAGASIAQEDECVTTIVATIQRLLRLVSPGCNENLEIDQAQKSKT